MQAQLRGGEAPAPGMRLVPRAAAGAGGGCRGSPGKRGRALEAGYVAPNAVYERALSGRDLGHVRASMGSKREVGVPKILRERV